MDAKNLEAELKLEQEQALIHFNIQQIDSICHSIAKVKKVSKPQYDFSNNSGRTDIAKPIHGDITKRGKKVGEYLTLFLNDKKSNDFVKII